MWRAEAATLQRSHDRRALLAGENIGRDRRGRRAPRERLKAVRPAHSARGASTSKAEVPQQAGAFTNHEDERNCTDQTPSDTDAKKKAVCVQEKNLFEVEIVLTAGVLLTQQSKPPECRFAYAMLS